MRAALIVMVLTIAAWVLATHLIPPTQWCAPAPAPAAASICINPTTTRRP